MVVKITENNEKNVCNVEFEEILELKDFIDYECGYNEESLYCLFGVINHIGSLESGHYYSYILNNDSWYEFNDRIVQLIDNDFDTSNAYILFYRKIH